MDTNLKGSARLEVLERFVSEYRPLIAQDWETPGQALIACAFLTHSFALDIEARGEGSAAELLARAVAGVLRLKLQGE